MFFFLPPGNLKSQSTQITQQCTRLLVNLELQDLKWIRVIVFDLGVTGIYYQFLHCPLFYHQSVETDVWDLEWGEQAAKG